MMGRTENDASTYEIPDVDVVLSGSGGSTELLQLPEVDVVQRLPNTLGIGIDIGMTFSGASIYYSNHNGSASYAVIPCEPSAGRNSAKFASVVFEPADGSVSSVGAEAVTKAKGNEPGRPFELFKRRLGVPLAQQPPDDQMDAKDLTAKVIRHVLDQVDDYLRVHHSSSRIKPVYRFTAPGMWRDVKLKAFTDAIRDAGFTGEYGVVEEPVATAVAASRLGLSPKLRGPQRRFVLVCDFGGGTFDLALISTDPTQRVATKAATGGNPDLGMSNLDKAILLLIWKKRQFITDEEYNSVLGAGIIAGPAFEELWTSACARVLDDRNLLFQMREVCEQLKKNICKQWESIVRGSRNRGQMTAWTAILPGGAGQEIEVTRDELEPLVDAMLATAADALHKYITIKLTNIPDLPDFDARSINLALVGGGGALLPGIEQALRRALPGDDVDVINITKKAEKTGSAGINQHALGLVQVGAAMVAAQPQLIAERRAPASYGMAVRRFMSDELPRYPESEYLATVRTDSYNGLTEETYIAYSRFFQQNQTLPVEPVEIEVSPQKAGQNEYHIFIYVGENENPFKNHHLGTVHARLPARARTEDQIRIVCYLGDDGLFHVEGRAWDNSVSGDVKLDLREDDI